MNTIDPAEHWPEWVRVNRDELRAQIGETLNDWKHYIIQNGLMVEVDFATWTAWFEHMPEERMLERTVTPNGDVSTIFLGMDHGFGLTKRKLLFETMIFGGTEDGNMWRTATLGEAKANHARVVEALRKGEAP